MERICEAIQGGQMNLNRRNFIQTGALAVAGASTLTLEGCTFGSVMGQLAKYLPIGLFALAGVANLISPGAGTLVASLIGLIQSAWGGLQAAVNDYNAAPSASKQTMMGKVLEALDAVQSELAKTASALGVGGTVALKAAEAALLLITSTLAAIESQLAPQAAPSTAAFHANHASAHSVSSVSVTGMPVAVSGKPADFVKTFNKIMDQAGRTDLHLK
jgi:hypothetical protein